MKTIVFLIVIFLMISCSDGNSNSQETKSADNTATEKKTDQAVTSSGTQGEGIVGEWELLGFVNDTNDNLQIDENERKDLKTPSFKDYMKLNSDGSGLFTVGRMEGRYEAKTEQGGGKEYLTWYDRANGPHKIGTIIKVTKEELHIKEPGGNGLFIWKRL